MSARDEVLARVRRAIGAPAEVRIPRDYRGPGGRVETDLVALLAERVDDYRANVHRCAPDELPARIAELLGTRNRVVVPDGIPPSWVTPDRRITDDPQLTAAQLDATDGVVTTCACAIALTGTIVLDHGSGQGRRALSLVPDYHLVVVRTEQIVAGVPDAIARLDPTAPLTFISGPSATSDIELDRVEGVHGPRTLDVVISG
jgi:L-lactate dehydrogenase complex protein LldG